jgi:hypothetical protein
VLRDFEVEDQEGCMALRVSPCLWDSRHTNGLQKPILSSCGSTPSFLPTAVRWLLFHAVREIVEGGSQLSSMKWLEQDWNVG